MLEVDRFIAEWKVSSFGSSKNQITLTRLLDSYTAYAGNMLSFKVEAM